MEWKFPVREDKITELKARMERLHIQESDLEEQFIRGSGKGGQKINKTSNKVRLRYVPLDLIVTCQVSRERSMNRFYALRLLLEKIEEHQRSAQGLPPLKHAQVERIRKQKQRRQRRSAKKHDPGQEGPPDGSDGSGGSGGSEPS